MNAKKKTKKLILDAASRLFAEHGYRQVTTRMIAESAGMSHGLLHYYFKNKNSIYYEVIKLVYDTDDALTYQGLLEMEPLIMENEASQAYVVYRLVVDYFKRYVFFSEPWKLRLIQREIVDPSPVHARLFREMFISRWEQLTEFFQLLKPDANVSEALYWAHYADTQGLYYHHLSIWRDTQLHTIDDQCQTELRSRMIGSTSRTMIEMLNLPVPEFLRLSR